jgi:hypothetical protein
MSSIAVSILLRDPAQNQQVGYLQETEDMDRARSIELAEILP